MKRRYRVQRLAHSEEKAVVKRIFWLTVFSIFLIAIIFTIGISFLGKFADFVESTFGSKEEDISVQGLRTPIIDTLPKVTNQQEFNITGFSPDGVKVELHINGERKTEVEIVDGKFEIKGVVLFRGKNDLFVKALDDSGNTSDPSASATIDLDLTDPKLEIETPFEGQNFKENNKIRVLGKTDSDSQVLANGFLANVDGSGNFEVSIPLSEGENLIKIEAKDEAGNIKSQEIKVHFSK